MNIEYAKLIAVTDEQAGHQGWYCPDTHEVRYPHHWGEGEEENWRRRREEQGRLAQAPDPMDLLAGQLEIMDATICKELAKMEDAQPIEHESAKTVRSLVESQRSMVKAYATLIKAAKRAKP